MVNSLNTCSKFTILNKRIGKWFWIGIHFFIVNRFWYSLISFSRFFILSQGYCSKIFDYVVNFRAYSYVFIASCYIYLKYMLAFIFLSLSIEGWLLNQVFPKVNLSPSKKTCFLQVTTFKRKKIAYPSKTLCQILDISN